MPKQIKYNVPKNADAAEFDAEPNVTIHADGVTVYVDEIRETSTGYVLQKYGQEVGYISDDDCDVSPKTALEHAKESPNEKIRFAD